MLGQTLSHYRVTARIGAGGMGEVYRATDTSLGRDVAIKVLPPEVTRDPERLARFRREAHVLASLNHPHIAAIYGLEEAAGQPFLALELVEGEDLKERLDRGPIPLDETLEIALHVAEALEEAHNKGIVHRDLKPANVKVTPDGKVKVLDFGLAKAWAGEDGSGSSSAALSQSPTLAHTGTVAGVILGTAAYMSPEQARGKPVDKRADVWSFGVLLWEMLTGRALFAGETVSDVLASVLKVDPELGALPADTPSSVRKLIARCLRKDPRQRLPDMGAARLELQEAIAAPGLDAGAASASPKDDAAALRRARVRERLILTGLALAGFGLAAWFAWSRRGTAPERARPVLFAAELPKGLDFGEVGWPVPSPDGSQVAFVGTPVDPVTRVTGAATIWMRTLDSLEARPVPATEGGGDGLPFWSPDSRVLGFFAAGEIRRLNLADGTVRRICALPEPGGFTADWGPDGTILFSGGGRSSRIYQVHASGGEPKLLTKHDTSRGENAHHLPRFLPDGRRFLFTVFASKPENAGLFVASVDHPEERHRVAKEWLHYEYADGYLLFARDGVLFAQALDAARAALSGEPVAIAASVAQWSALPAVGRFGASSAKTLAMYSGDERREPTQLAWVDREGTTLSKVGDPGRYGQVALSPDERTIAVEISADALASNLWLMDATRGVTSRLTGPGGSQFDAVWAPDGRSIAFASEAGDKVDVRRKGLRASDGETVLVDTPDREYPECWSPDGKTLLFLRHGRRKTAWALPLGGGDPVEVLRATGESIDEPQLSPDAHWIAYMSDESGRYEVYLEPVGRDAAPQRVSVNGGGQPKWRGDGRELFFATPAGEIMSVAVHVAGDRLELGLPAKLFQVTGMLPSGEWDEFAPSRDGQRFLVKLPTRQGEALQLRILTNWTSLLEPPTR